MEIISFYMLLKRALVDYEAINVWSYSVYGRDHNVLTRYDANDPPDVEDCPACWLSPDVRSAGQRRAIQTNTFGLGVVIHDSTEDGFDNLETYRKHLENAITAAISSSAIFMDELVVEYELENAFPFLFCGMDITFIEEFAIGGNRLS